MMLMIEVPNNMAKTPPTEVHVPPALASPIKTDLSRVCSTIFHSEKSNGVTMRMVDTSGPRAIKDDVRGSGHT